MKTLRNNFLAFNILFVLMGLLLAYNVSLAHKQAQVYQKYEIGTVIRGTLIRHDRPQPVLIDLNDAKYIDWK